MKLAALLLVATLATTSLGCHALSHGLVHKSGCTECGDIGGGCSDCESCSHDAPCADCHAADMEGLMHHHAGAGMHAGGGMLGDGGGLLHHNTQAPYPPGPPVGTVTYPYYTFHGPRDFLRNNPPSLGR